MSLRDALFVIKSMGEGDDRDPHTFTNPLSYSSSLTLVGGNDLSFALYFSIHPPTQLFCLNISRHVTFLYSIALSSSYERRHHPHMYDVFR
jgi:hypothetical protein